MICAGVDVGGRRKGFHAAAVRGTELVAGPVQLPDVDAVVRWVASVEPKVVAVDSPRNCAPAGERSRAGERKLAKEICGIRWTPDEVKIADNPYYEWIAHGLELYAALERRSGRKASAGHRGVPDRLLDGMGGP